MLSSLMSESWEFNYDSRMVNDKKDPDKIISYINYIINHLTEKSKIDIEDIDPDSDFEYVKKLLDDLATTINRSSYQLDQIKLALCKLLTGATMGHGKGR